MFNIKKQNPKMPSPSDNITADKFAGTGAETDAADEKFDPGKINGGKSCAERNWQLYEAGVSLKHRSGFYDKTRRNERFYNGNQWFGDHSEDLPKPVFNIVRRITDYLVATVAAGKIALNYTIPKSDGEKPYPALEAATEKLNSFADFRFANDNLGKTVYSLLLSAALDGSAGLYSRFDEASVGADGKIGEIRTELLLADDIFPSDFEKPDVQSQDYIILSGRERVSKLRFEALCAGADAKTLRAIVPDDPIGSFTPASGELNDGNDLDGKATFIIKFYKCGGKVCFEKSTRCAFIRGRITDLTLYPISFFSWLPARKSFFGEAPVTGLVPNQKFINRAYAMVMKHMTDTAFSKVVYDKSKIPEWSNRVGEAIGVVGGGNVADAVSVVGVGDMQDGYMELISSAIDATKELAGATGAALGEVPPSNTSAIIALAEAARTPLAPVRSAFMHLLEDTANVWADMSFSYMPEERIYGEDAVNIPASEKERLRALLTRASVEISEGAEYSSSATVSVLDKLLSGGHISAYEYVSRLPAGIICEREKLLAALKEKEKEKKEEKEKGNEGGADNGN